MNDKAYNAGRATSSAAIAGATTVGRAAKATGVFIGSFLAGLARVDAETAAAKLPAVKSKARKAPAAKAAAKKLKAA